MALTVVVIAAGAVLAAAALLERTHRPARYESAAVAILADPTFDTLPLETQNKQLRDAILTNTDRFRRWVRRALAAFVILAIGTTFAIWGVEHSARNTCIAMNHRFGHVRDGIDRLAAHTSTRGVTDPATLARIKASNAQKDAGRAALDPLLGDQPCPS